MRPPGWRGASLQGLEDCVQGRLRFEAHTRYVRHPDTSVGHWHIIREAPERRENLRVAFITAKAQADGDAPSPLKHELRIVFGTFGLLLLYAFLMEKTGFLVSTPVVLVLCMAGVLRMRNWRFIALMSIGTTLVCWIVFAVLLRVPLPRGAWWWLM
jgi:hypothetical protein